MIDPKDKAQVEVIIILSFIVAAIDLTLAIICAILGSSLFVPFMILSGLMFAYGKWLQERADEKGE